MGDRGADHTEAPTDDELDQLARLVTEGLAAGALGFATSRTDVHRTKDGTNIGTLTASERELLAIADAMRAAGTGVTQLISDCYQTPDDDFANRELDVIAAFARASRPAAELHGAAGVPLARAVAAPVRARRRAARRRPRREAAGRARDPIGVLLGLDATANPFLFTASFHEIAELAARRAARRAPRPRAHAAASSTSTRRWSPACSDGLFRQIVAGLGRDVPALGSGRLRARRRPAASAPRRGPPAPTRRGSSTTRCSSATATSSSTSRCSTSPTATSTTSTR